jgi:TatD DNase family protein
MIAQDSAAGRPAFLIDSHCHLDAVQFDPDRAEVLARARAAGVAAIVVPGIDLQHCRQAVALAAAQPEVYAAVGIHPNSSDTWGPETAAELHRLAQHPKVVALGEIGLDYYWDKVAPTTQQTVFAQQLDLAAAWGLPVIIHSRNANDDVADMLETWVHSPTFAASPLAARPFAGVLHAFSGDLALAQRAYAWNFLISLGGPVTFKNARDLHALIPQLRRDRLMLETDAPYLAPHPHRGQRNEPAYVARVCAQLAELWDATPQAVAQATSATAQRCFGLNVRAAAAVAQAGVEARRG